MASNHKKFIAALLKQITTKVDYKELKNLWNKKDTTEMEVFRVLGQEPSYGVEPTEALLRLQTGGLEFSKQEVAFIKETFSKSQLSRITSRESFDKLLEQRYRQRREVIAKKLRREADRLEVESSDTLTLDYDIDLPTDTEFRYLSTQDKVGAMTEVNKAYTMLRNKQTRFETFKDSIGIKFDQSWGDMLDRLVEGEGVDKARKIVNRAVMKRLGIDSDYADDITSRYFNIDSSEHKAYFTPKEIKIKFEPSKSSQSKGKTETVSLLAKLTNKTQKEVSKSVKGKTTYRVNKKIKKKVGK